MCLASALTSYIVASASKIFLGLGLAVSPSASVASTPIPGGRNLRPVKNRGGSFDKVVDQNFPLFSLANLHH